MHWKSPLVLGEGFGHFLLSCPYITNPDLMTGSHFCSWASPSSKQDPCTDIWTLTSNFYHKFPLFIQVNSNKYDPGVVSSGNFPLQEDVSSKCRFLLQTTPWLIRIACRDRSSLIIQCLPGLFSLLAGISLPFAILLPTSQKSRQHRCDYASVTVNLNIVT